MFTFPPVHILTLDCGLLMKQSTTAWMFLALNLQWIAPGLNPTQQVAWNNSACTGREDVSLMFSTGQVTWGSKPELLYKFIELFFLHSFIMVLLLSKTDWNEQDRTYMVSHQIPHLCQEYLGEWISNILYDIELIQESSDSLLSGYIWNGAVQVLLQQVGGAFPAHFFFSPPQLACDNCSHVVLQKLLSLQEVEEALEEDWPCCYTEEGKLEKHSELDCITIPDEEDSLQRALTDLGPAFIPLASVTQNTL